MKNISSKITRRCRYARPMPVSPSRFPAGAKAGMTLLELTVVILVLLATIAILFIGGAAWKKGSDRASCIMHLANVQKGVRGYSNIYGYSPGQIVSGLQANVIGLGKFVEEMPTCSRGGTYSTLGDTIPVVGVMYMNCSLATSDNHQPVDSSNW